MYTINQKQHEELLSIAGEVPAKYSYNMINILLQLEKVGDSEDVSDTKQKPVNKKAK